MNIYTSAAIINVAIIALIAFGIYHINSYEPLIGLLFLHEVKSAKIKNNQERD